MKANGKGDILDALSLYIKHGGYFYYNGDGILKIIHEDSRLVEGFVDEFNKQTIEKLEETGVEFFVHYLKKYGYESLANRFLKELLNRTEIPVEKKSYYKRLWEEL